MKKYKVTMVVAMLAMLALLAGCPSVNLQDAEAGSDAVDAVSADTAAAAVAMPNSTDGNPYLGGADIPDGMGAVTVSGSFYDVAKSLEKSVNRNNVVDLFKKRATAMEFNFYPVEPTTTPAKGGENGLYFRIPIKNGSFFGKFTLKAGEYNVGVTVIDTNYNGLFWSSASVSVVAGQGTVMAVELQLYDRFNYRFKVIGLGGEYPAYGQATIVTDDGQTYSAFFYEEYGKGKSLAIDIVFSAYLPVDFDGYDNGAVLTMMDNDGLPHVTELNFCIFDAVYGVFGVEYVYPEDVGEVDVNISFVEYPEENGKG